MSAAAAVLVLDASLALAWALPDEASAYSDSVLHRVAAGGALVPALWPYEMANGLLVAGKRGRCTTAQRMAIVEQLLRLPIEVDVAHPRAVLDAQAGLAIPICAGPA